ncbi:MAG: hypothetical protein A3C82_02335 [Candidatus Wildermuthbacteria bacterium RIFCSPHIGHO2_02_FULL_47_12]|uniref:Histidine kinase N-terminal 7TM region domain-containing protein n=1 Tax=Candidatus Wildermuthbacteria bacterium RIFCSPHIGHO2_02_FULL_47_12 TaxID=1802451 RepID=A0A1G2R2K6_9BACT|nr:MAG: hypothetical protein A3C82_02335 [Candidatus Wildermuthbacteria bacterium RIFCSPHIGHO2_02_FULL_47_12]
MAFIFTFTGLSYLIGSAVLSLLAMRFFRSWRQERSLPAHMLFFFVLFLLIFFILTTILSLFFAQSASALKFVTVMAIFLQGISLSFLGYLLLRMQFPSVSPVLGPLCILLASLVFTVLAMLDPYAPSLHAEGLVIQWNVPLYINIPRMFLFLLTFLPLAWVFFQEYRMTQERKAKRKALGLAIVMSTGFVMTIFDFLVERLFGLSEIMSDIWLNVLFSVLFFVVLLPAWSKRQEMV